MRLHATSGSASDSHTKDPPSAIPESGLECVKAFGSQHSTTLTCRRSQCVRMCLREATRKYAVGAPFFSEP